MRWFFNLCRLAVFAPVPLDYKYAHIIGIAMCIQGWEWYAGEKTSTAISAKMWVALADAGKVWENKLGNRISGDLLSTGRIKAKERYDMPNRFLYWQRCWKARSFHTAKWEIASRDTPHTLREVCYCKETRIIINFKTDNYGKVPVSLFECFSKVGIIFEIPFYKQLQRH